MGSGDREAWQNFIDVRLHIEAVSPKPRKKE